MRILLVSPKYPQTFWSLDRVLPMLHKKALMPPLALLTVAALLPPDWDMRLVDLTVRDMSEEDWAQCDVVMVTGMATQVSGLFQIIREGRKRDKIVVVGGPLVFHVPQDALKEGADIVVKGEAEGVVPRLVAALTRGESGIVIEQSARANLRESPPPRYDLVDNRPYLYMSVQFSRGCPFQCEFCDISLMFGRNARTKSAEQILNELQNIYELGWRRGIFFVDDNFVGNVRDAKALLKKMVPWMEERGYPFDFFTQASVNLAADPELLELIVRAGFSKVFLGIETTDRDILSRVRKHQNAVVNLDRACDKINRAGLQIIAGCIVGFDEEPPGAGQRLIDFAIRNRIPEMFVTLLQAGPGTDLWERLESEGRLRSEGYDDNFGNQTGSINFVPTRPIGEIVQEFVRVYDVLYDRRSYLERAFQHVLHMGPAPYKKPFSLPQWSELRAVTITLFRQGVIHPSRWLFWKLLLTALIRFPGRIHHFFAYCVLAEHYSQYRATIRKHFQGKWGQDEHMDSSETSAEFATPRQRTQKAAAK